MNNFQLFAEQDITLQVYHLISITFLAVFEANISPSALQLTLRYCDAAINLQNSIQHYNNIQTTIFLDHFNDDKAEFVQKTSFCKIRNH